MDRNEPPFAIQRQPVRRSTFRFRAGPASADESTLLLIALIGGAVIGYFAALG